MKTKFIDWPWATLGIIVLNVLFFSWQTGANNVYIGDFVEKNLAFNWADFAAHPLSEAPRLISHTLLHADNQHLLWNMIFLGLVAPGVEAVMGHALFVIGYFFWGALAAFTQSFFSPVGGAIGASGAVSGVMGAYFVLHPLKMPPNYLVYIFGIWVRKMPAFLIIGLYYLEQIHGGFLTLFSPTLSHIAYWAHVGGFSTGALSMFPYLFRRNVDTADC